MGIQSTTKLTRLEAEGLYLEHYVKRHRQELEEGLRHLSDEDLENELEQTFENYMIVPDSYFTNGGIDED